MPYLERERSRIYYEDAGSGPSVLLTHGFGASTAMWRTQVEALSPRYRLITWDMRGHGGTECLPDQSRFSQSETVADMAALLEHLGIERAVIGGHSLGGFMSLAFHVTHPTRVQALYLQGCGPGYRSAVSRHAWNERAENRARTLEAGGLAALGGGAEVKASRQRSAEDLARAARGILSQVDSRVIDSLRSILVPTLIVIGDGDTPYLAGAGYMAEHIPGARQVVIDGAGHGVNVEKPDRVTALLREFLDSLSPVAPGATGGAGRGR